jgi:uncharacterized membrane protein YraQ (UPF0718 family)
MKAKAASKVGKVVTAPEVRLDTTHQFLDKLMELYELKTDYQLHKLLGTSKQSIYRYRANAVALEDSVARKAVDLILAKMPELGTWLTPEYAMACMQIERARKSPEEQKWWERIRKQLRHANESAQRVGFKLLAAATIGGALSSAPTPSNAAPSPSSDGPRPVYYVKYRMQP